MSEAFRPDDIPVPADLERHYVEPPLAELFDDLDEGLFCLRFLNLKKTDEAIPARINNTGLVETAELALAGALAKAEKDTEAAIQSHDYVAVLKRLAQLRAPVDEFFNGVMVMADDAALRRNRLALLKRLSDRFLQVADISQLSAG